MWLKTVNQVHDYTLESLINTLTSHTFQIEEGVVWYNDTCFVSVAHSSFQATAQLIAACSMEKSCKVAKSQAKAYELG